MSAASNDGEIPWDELRRRATGIAQQAYAPYSDFGVGAAALTDDGRIVTGCNVENLSYGLTLCAECSLVSMLHATGGGKLVAVVVVSASGAPAAPCGRCRQVLAEHAAPDCLVDETGSPLTIDELLPHAFTTERLAEG